MSFACLKQGKALIAVALSLTMSTMLLGGCAPSQDTARQEAPEDVTLTWEACSGFEGFFKLVAETYPDIDIEIDPYAGANRTGYTWAQMRAGDIPEVFVTSQLFDEGLAKERLIDLADYGIVDDVPTALLDQVAIDGGVYLIPVSNAMYGIYYNKTLMEEHGWEVPTNYDELAALCKEIEAAGITPGIVGTALTGGPFSAVFNLAKTDWLSTPEGARWEEDFLAGDATAEGMWEDTLDYVGDYMDIGMFTPDPEDRNDASIILDYLDNRTAVFCTTVLNVNITELPESGDEIGMMPYIGKTGDKNIYMYSTTNYIGLSKELAQPGNEEKLAAAIDVLSLLFSPEGQASFITEATPTVLSVLEDSDVPEDSMVYDAQQALRNGRAFPMTYVGWEGILADVGAGFKEYLRGEGGMDAQDCIELMDSLQRDQLDSGDLTYFAESDGDFTREQTAQLIGAALAEYAGADGAVIAVGDRTKSDIRLLGGVTGKLYADKINTDVANTIVPGSSAGFVVLSLTGSQIEEIVEEGYDIAGDGDPFPYVLVTRDGFDPQEDRIYRMVFLNDGYTDAVAENSSATETVEESLFDIVREYLERHTPVSPDMDFLS